MIDVDTDALRRGVAVAAAVAIPVAVLAFVFIGDTAGERGPVLFLFSLVVLAALVAGAAVAGYLQRTGTPLAHGIVTALVVWAVLTVIRLVRLAFGDGDVAWAPVVSNLLLSLIAGTVGGLVGGRRAARRADEGGAAG